MLQYLSKSISLLAFLVVITCGFYPLVLWIIGQTVFPFQANGSLLLDSMGKPLGSKLIAQPFTKNEYFHSRPSAASYDASASASSALAASNYTLRDRIARSLGPIVKYDDGQPVAPNVEKWFQQDKFQNKPNIVAQWATLHNSLAQAWVNADASHGAFVENWMKIHPAILAQFVKDNPGIPQPKPADLAVVFFQNFSKENPGKFPSTVSHTRTDGKVETTIEPLNAGSDIQSIFFDMWRQEHPNVVLQDVPGDLVTTSGSGLDPHITLQNAEFQLDRIVAKWAANLQRNPAEIRKEIKRILEKNAHAPFAGLVGEKFINVLEVNLELHNKYGPPQ
ncbi:MAG: potassium-transporting ATPase subunit C [Bacillota bacterium]|nr:potassium-transporting ATPase subunit C [Bacillota bacterium]